MINLFDDEEEYIEEEPKYNMEADMLASAWFVAKCKQNYYAQNLYAAMCNMRWQKVDVMPILKDEYWSASWRGSGGIVARIRDCGEDYLDYYCSGIVGGISYDTTEDERIMAEKGFVPEGVVTEEIETDLRQLGWQPSPWPED